MLSPGNRFPDLRLDSTEGTVDLSERWGQGPLVVAFMRHFGCAFCREHLLLLGEAYDEIRAKGGDVVAVFQYRAEPTRNFCRHRNVPFDCLGDPERDAYTQVSLGQGPREEWLGRHILRGWVRTARRGVYPGLVKGDASLQPGTFVVGTDGRLTYAHYNKDSTDNAPIADVLAAL
jgi:peroxiredoxin